MMIFIVIIIIYYKFNPREIHSWSIWNALVGNRGKEQNPEVNLVFFQDFPKKRKQPAAPQGAGGGGWRCQSWKGSSEKCCGGSKPGGGTLSIFLLVWFDFLPGKTQTTAAPCSGCVVLPGKIKIPEVGVPSGEENSWEELRQSRVLLHFIFHKTKIFRRFSAFLMEKYSWRIRAVQDNKLILLLPPHFQKSVIIVSNLCKEYKIKQAGSFFKKKKKTATKNLSICVKKGENWDCSARPGLNSELIPCTFSVTWARTGKSNLFVLLLKHLWSGFDVLMVHPVNDLWLSIT